MTDFEAWMNQYEHDLEAECDRLDISIRVTLGEARDLFTAGMTPKQASSATIAKHRPVGD